MKRVLLPVLSLVLISLCITGCSKGKDSPKATPTNAPIINVTPTLNAATQAPTIAPNETASPEDNKLVYMIEDFNSMTDPLISMNPVDLSMYKNYGLTSPELSLVNGYAEEGNALNVSLVVTNWCQIYQINDTTRLNIFKENAKTEYYLKMYIANITNVNISCTIGFTDGYLKSYIDASQVIITDIEGVTLENITSDATSDAGVDSAITVPTNFIGWIAWPLNVDYLKEWNNKTGILTDLKTVNNIILDIRPAFPGDQSFYVLDNLCITDSPN